MRCGYCNKNEATKTYEQIKNGKKTHEYYCMDCYHRLFLSMDDGENEASLSVCPYCGMTLEEFQASKIVGCAFCYRMMKNGIYPTVTKMQGDCAHTGKRPMYFKDEKEEEEFDVLPTNLQKEVVQNMRWEKQCNELERIIEKLKSEDNFEDAKNYADKLSSMRSKAEIEEEFVWRTRKTASKQP